MMLPLHKDAQGVKKDSNAHAGLWYDRFFNKYDDACKVGDDGKLKWINTVTGSVVGDQNMLEAYAKRQRTLIDACGGETLVMSSQWHFVTGMGNNHPVENGFSWHHTLGVPYLTGAAVKGMVRAWCEVWQEFDSEKMKRWFGDTEQSGELIFFDAVPVRPVKLKADIMTPHYGDWYAKGDEAAKSDGSNIPADWHDPVPVPFLVVDKGQSFQFSFAKRANSSIELKDVSDALTQALQWLGAGAKTATGYGRLQRNEALEEQIKDKQLKQEEVQVHQAVVKREIAALGLSGVALKMVQESEQEGWSSDKGAFIPMATKWLSDMESESDEMRLSVCQWLTKKLEALYPGIMVNPDKKQGKKQNDVYKPATRNLAHALRNYRTDKEC